MAAQEIPGPAERLTIVVDLDAPAEEAFEHLTRTALLTRWWPTEAELDLRIGGGYRFSWPAQELHLSGRYMVVEPPRRLAFTWSWEHEPNAPEREVDVTIEPTADGSRLTLVHSLYGSDDPEQSERDSHREGWLHFLDRLADLVAVDDVAPTDPEDEPSAEAEPSL